MAAKLKKRTTRHYHLAHKDREYFTTNMAMLLGAAVPVGDIFSSLAETSRSKTLKKALLQMQNDVEDGLPLWKALERSGIAPMQTLALVQLGEESGDLVQNLKVAAQQEEKQRTFRSKVRSALLYPLFVVSLTVIVGIGVSWFLLPKLAQTFAQLKVELPLISQILINFGVFLQTSGYWAVPAAIFGTLFMIYILFSAPPTKHLGQRLLMHIPGVSRLMHEIETARFGYLLGTLLEAGLSVTEALKLMQKSTGVPAYRKLYAYLYNSFDEGYGFNTSMPKYKKTQKLLSPAVQQMIIAGERSGSLPDTLKNIGQTYEQKADISTQNLETILEPILLIIVWFGVLAVAIAVILPIYSLVGNLQSV